MRSFTVAGCTRKGSKTPSMTLSRTPTPHSSCPCPHPTNTLPGADPCRDYTLPVGSRLRLQAVSLWCRARYCLTWVRYARVILALAMMTRTVSWPPAPSPEPCQHMQHAAQGRAVMAQDGISCRHVKGSHSGSCPLPTPTGKPIWLLARSGAPKAKPNLPAASSPGPDTRLITVNWIHQDPQDEVHQS